MKQRRTRAPETQGERPESPRRKAGLLLLRPVSWLSATIIAAIVASLAVVYAPRLLNTVIPGRPVVDVDTVDNPPVVDAANDGARPPVAYNAFAFPRVLTPAELQELNTTVAGQEAGGTGPGPEAITWMRAHDAYDVGGLVTRVVVQAIDQPVRVLGVRAEIEERKPPVGKTVLYTPPEGSDDVVVAALNLDEREPSAPHFAASTESLNPGESVVIDVEASVSKYSVVWRIAIDYTAAGKEDTYLVGHEDGGPFRTTGLPNATPKKSGTRDGFLRQYPDPWWFRYPVADGEKPVYVRGLPSR
ncbi:hypothetical protein [Actinophytocola xanthii]|uniref:Uncharacterized protein n=1 Tax=Actinophytocola xanthii TaxID=1912961 RepID=A0A1Q8C8Y9_9PSEU|nr:hypothetical protein [Actinophytocola xanthii]OLF10820.1 hypothetical protein BU204_30915 [Actinophytocola xanthii]